MHIDWDVPITMDDATVLRADVFRPTAPGRYPVVLSHGVYGKGLPIEVFRHQLNHLAATLPENVKAADLADAFSPDATTEIADDDYRVWETVDPSHWVPQGFVCVRVDARGSGSSPGCLDPLSPREIDDFAACIEWAGTQPWSNGRVGLCGKSYYAMTQWLVAARRPRHLAAICVWHGASDFYRDATRHGGILYEFWEKFWYPSLALPVQHGRGPKAGRNPHSGLPIAGEHAGDEAALAEHRADLPGQIRSHPLDDDYYRLRSPRLDRINVPVLAAADWSDHDLHLRGTIQGFLDAPVADKWLEIHAGGQFDDPDAADLQQRFLAHYLKTPGTGGGSVSGDGSNDWARQPRVQLAVRHVDGTTTIRHFPQWPLPDTDWRAYHLDLDGAPSFGLQPAAQEFQATYKTLGPGVTFLSSPMPEDSLIAGPVAAKLYLSSATTDADVFLVLDAVDPEGRRVELRDHRNGIAPLSIGWLRASHRATDHERSKPWQPRHTHRTPEPLIPGTAYELEIELRPTALLVPEGYRLRLTITGHGAAHDDPADRPAEVFDTTVTVHTGPATPSHLLVPFVPSVTAHRA